MIKLRLNSNAFTLHRISVRLLFSEMKLLHSAKKESQPDDIEERTLLLKSVSNDAENSTLHYRYKLHFKIHSNKNSYFKLYYFTILL